MTQLAFHIDVVSSAESIYSGLIQTAVIPTTEGDIAVYAHHAPLLGICRAGQLKLQYEDGKHNFLYISGGLVEVHPKGVTVLADTVTRAEDIDEAAAIKAKQDALTMIARRDDNCDCAASYAELLNSLAMLKTLDNCRRHQ